MAIRNIVQVGDLTLRKKCYEVTDFGEKTSQLLDDMRETLDKSGGVGLAAPQVGVLKRIFIVSYENKYYECINPVLYDAKGQVSEVEACLSVKGRRGVVVRPREIKVNALDRKGNPFSLKLKGFITRIFCHENDHLDGILFIDKATDIEEE